MKNIFKLSLIALIVLFTVSCENILVEDPPSSISLSSFYQSESDALAGLYGAYSIMYDVLGNNSVNYGELNADDLGISPIVSDRFEWDYFTYNSDVTGGLWSSCYSGINRANEFPNIFVKLMGNFINGNMLVASISSIVSKNNVRL